MALLASTGLRNQVLDTGSIKSALANGFIRVYSSTIGNIPATADAAIDGGVHTLLLTVYGDGIRPAAAPSARRQPKPGRAQCWPLATLCSSATSAALIPGRSPLPSRASRAVLACPARS